MEAFAASLLAVIPLTLLARILAITLRTPVTVFLLTGIFPLVPGAGIYYSAYYFIQATTLWRWQNGISTFKIAVALAVGIALVLGHPPAAETPIKQKRDRPPGGLVGYAGAFNGRTQWKGRNTEQKCIYTLRIGRCMYKCFQKGFICSDFLHNT